MDPIVNAIVDRCSVGEDYLAVMRQVCSRVKGGRKRFLKLSRRIKRNIIRDTLNRHMQNRDLYLRVTKGDI